MGVERGGGIFQEFFWQSGASSAFDSNNINITEFVNQN